MQRPTNFAPQTKRLSYAPVGTSSRPMASYQHRAGPPYAPQGMPSHHDGASYDDDDDAESGDMDVDNDMSSNYAEPFMSKDDVYAGAKAYNAGGAQAAQDKPKDNFVTKLHRVLETNAHFQVIHWQDDEKFVIRDQDAFVSTAMQQICQTSNFETFVRQLNMYGFKKIGRAPRGNNGSKEKKPLVFQHSEQLFLRGREDLLQQIERKHANTSAVADTAHYGVEAEPVASGAGPARGLSVSGPVPHDINTTLQRIVYNFEVQLRQIKAEVQALKQTCDSLTRDNQTLKDEIVQLKAQVPQPLNFDQSSQYSDANVDALGSYFNGETGFDFLSSLASPPSEASAAESSVMPRFMDSVIPAPSTRLTTPTPNAPMLQYNQTVKPSMSPPPAGPSHAAVPSLGQTLAPVNYGQAQTSYHQTASVSAYHQSTIDPSLLNGAQKSEVQAAYAPIAGNTEPSSPVQNISHTRGGGVATVPAPGGPYEAASRGTTSTLLSGWNVWKR